MESSGGHSVVNQRGAASAEWREISSRSYTLRAPPPFVRAWLIDHGVGALRHAPPSHVRAVVELSASSATESLVDSKSGMERESIWDFRGADSIIVLKRVEKGGKVLVEGWETYRFQPAGDGTQLHLTVHQRPRSGIVRIGLRLFPSSARRSPQEEERLVTAIENDWVSTRIHNTRS